ncbi:hypothetical protein ACO3VM_04130 [Methanocaldococcus sp. 10A]
MVYPNHTVRPVKKDIIIGSFTIPYNFLVALVFFFAYFDFLIVIPYIKSTIYNLRPEVDIIVKIACLANDSPISITREAMISLKKIDILKKDNCL